MLNEVCIGENICSFREGSSGVDLKCAVESLLVTEQLSEPFCMRVKDSSKSVDAPDLLRADVQEGSFGSGDAEELSTADPLEESFATDMKPVVEGLPVTQQLSDPSCSEKDDSSNHLDAQHLGGADIQEGLPAIDSKPTVEGIPVTQQLSDPSCIENNNLAKSEDTHYLARADLREESSPNDIRPTVERTSVTQPISDPSCSGYDDFLKSDDNVIHPFGANFWEGSSPVEKLSVSQQFAVPSCTENDDISKTDDAQGLSGGDSWEGPPITGIKASVARSLISERLLDPSCIENAEVSETVDAEDLSGAGLKEGSSPRNLNSVAEISSVSGQVSEPSRTTNHDLSKGLDAQDLFRSDCGEQLSATNLGSTVEILLVSQHMSEPSCTGDNDFSKSVVAYSGGDGFVTTSDSIHVGGFAQSGNGGKCTIKVDGALEASLPDSMCVPPRKRSLRNTRSKSNAQAEKPGGNNNSTNKKVSLNLDSFQIIKRRRSCTSKRARSSVWGWLMDVQVFEQNGGVDINFDEHKKSARVQGGQARGKRVKNQSQTCSERSKRRSCGVTGRISLKVKVGVALGPSSMVDISSDNNIQKTTETFPVLSKEDGSPKAEGFQGCKENLDGTVTCSDDSISEFHLSCNSIVNKTFDDLQQFPLETEADRLGTSTDSRGLDSGTSPDSEVINLNPDAPYAGKGLEDLHDILSSSKACVASEDVSSLSQTQKCMKKGKKKKKTSKAGDCSPKGELLNSETMDNVHHVIHQVTEVEQGEKAGDVSYSTEASASLITANISGNTSSTENMSKEHLSSRVPDFEKSCKTGKPDHGTEINLSSSICNEVESAASQVLNKPLSRNKGRKTSKCAKAEGTRNKKSGENSSRKKITRDKSISKLKLKEKLNGGLTSCESEGRVQTDVMLSDKGDSGTGNSSLTADMSTLEIEPRGVMEQLMEQNPKPRNAWVQCDDCHKWRRIPATLADQIDETNSRWICKDNTDKDFSDCSIPQEKSNAEINAELDISDASCDEDAACAAQRDSNQSRKSQSAVAQNSKWRLIKSNLFLHRSRKTQSIDEIMVCHCKPPTDGRMGCGDGCLNRMLNIECVQGTCPSGELCSNQQFQRRKYAKLKCVKCGKKGHGLQVLQDISEGQFLIEYVGEVLDMQTYEARQREYALNGHKHFYFMTLNGSEVIDACAKGNLGRFINHSCDPNCRTEKWMVNGEVCIGLFALRNIKKGEELTFDYNYVRVFGAAAKKCVCGSSQCQGFIGGDPQNAEVIVQDDSEDEYPEPVMICEDDVSGESLNDKVTARKSFNCLNPKTAKELPQDMDKVNKSGQIVKDLDVATEVQSATTEVAQKVEIDNSATDVGYVGNNEENGDLLNRSTSATAYLSVEMEESVGQLQSLARHETAFKLDGSSSENVSIGEHDCSAAERNMKRSSCSTAGLEENSPSTLGKFLPDAMDSKRKLKSGIGRSRVKSSKSQSFMKNSRSPSSVKQEKPKGYVADKKFEQMHGKFDLLHCKSKKIIEGSSSFHFEAVQEKLNELLDHDGGISKRKDSSRGYLKLLLLTAASGDGETIQSNRDLSMILDALLKTKSRTVLVDVINKNGLQMLHNMLKRYRKEFKKIPILRKLLKVLEYLATREILTSEQINGGPPRPGVESFRESILSLTEHIDKQVHQIARSFRDRWIPRSARKNNCMDREGNKSEFHRGLDYSKFSVHNRLSDRSGRHSETPEPISESIVTSSTVDAGTMDSSHPCSTSTRTRKRKSRWDQPADPDPSVGNNMACEGDHNIDDDVPPGFAAPLNASVVPSVTSLHAHCTRPNSSNGMRRSREVSLGHPQQRFVSRIPVSYGVPLLTVQQMGTPHQGRLDGWSVAPGIPFNPFPPLPLYPRDKRDQPGNAADSSVMGQPAQIGEQDHNNRSSSHHTGVSPPSSSTASLQDVEMSAGNKLNSQQSRGSNTLGRKYFRQQKWNNSKLGPPWIRNRNNWSFAGNNSRNGMYNVGPGPNEFRNPHPLEQVNVDMDSYAYHHHQPPQ